MELYAHIHLIYTDEHTYIYLFSLVRLRADWIWQWFSSLPSSSPQKEVHENMNPQSKQKKQVSNSTCLEPHQTTLVKINFYPSSSQRHMQRISQCLLLGKKKGSSHWQLPFERNGEPDVPVRPDQVYFTSLVPRKGTSQRNFPARYGPLTTAFSGSNEAPTRSL